MSGRPAKPPEVHDRDREWATVCQFAADPAAGATLGFVYGRRRQGKTFLLNRLANATGGFMFTAQQQAGPQNLASLAAAYAAFRGLDVDISFPDWRVAVDALLALGEGAGRPVPVVIDEFPFLLESAPNLPSLIQIALEPFSRARRESGCRLVLCGSALTTMKNLLSGSAPLRGRHVMELVVHPFSFRDAATFWGVDDDPELAFRIGALLGGTPAYRQMSGGPPSRRSEFEAWVRRGPLNPSGALFREGNLLLYQESEITDVSLYHAVLAAVATGACRRSEIAARLGRPDSALSHPLAVLEHTQLVRRVPDALNPRRPVYHIAEPVLRLHQLVIAPRENLLVSGEAARVWSAAADTVAAKIYGPHLEDLAREWSLLLASPATTGGLASQALPATVACREHRISHEIDVVVLDETPARPRRILAIGEVKATAKLVSESELTRLDHIRDLLPGDLTPQPPRVLLFARAGFTAALRRIAATRNDVELVGLDRLYTGE